MLFQGFVYDVITKEKKTKKNYEAKEKGKKEKE